MSKADIFASLGIAIRTLAERTPHYFAILLFVCFATLMAADVLKAKVESPIQHHSAEIVKSIDSLNNNMDKLNDQIQSHKSELRTLNRRLAAVERAIFNANANGNGKSD